MDLIGYIAIYGAFLSTGMFLWNIYITYQDKPKIEIKASFGGIIGIGDKRTIFIVEAVNTGKKAITLSSMGLRAGDQDILNIHVKGLPHRLIENTSHSEWFYVDTLKDHDIDFAWYKDQTGKMYKSKNIRHKFDTYFKKNGKKKK